MISKIAIFRALYLGDMLCIVPTVRAIKKAHPEAEIFLVGLSWEREFVERFSVYFNHFIEFPGWPGLPEQQPQPETVVQFLHEIRAYNFDLILQMQGNGELTNRLCMLWGGQQVCGLRKPGEYAPVEHLFPVSEDNEHEVLRFMKLLDCLQIRSRGTDLEFPIREGEHARAMSLLQQAGLHPGHYVCIHPGARDKRRRWSVDHFAFIANQLATHGLPIVLTGSLEEKGLLGELQHKIKTPVLNIVEAFGHLGVGELASIIKKTRLLISNDTGVSHIAAALRVPSVIIFSAFSDINRWRPLNETQHIAIPYGQASDMQYVLQQVMGLLRGHHIETAVGGRS